MRRPPLAFRPSQHRSGNSPPAAKRRPRPPGDPRRRSPTAEAGTPDEPATPAKNGSPSWWWPGGTRERLATVRSDGSIPFPGISTTLFASALKFKPRNPTARLKAEVRFLIRRDGSVADITFVRRSGNFSFDLEAQGAVEAASSARAFGPLPEGFPDDALPVVFSFDPAFLR